MPFLNPNIELKPVLIEEEGARLLREKQAKGDPQERATRRLPAAPRKADAWIRITSRMTEACDEDDRPPRGKRVPGSEINQQDDQGTFHVSRKH